MQYREPLKSLFTHGVGELENRRSTSRSHEQAKASRMTISFCLIVLNKKCRARFYHVCVTYHSGKYCHVHEQIVK